MHIGAHLTPGGSKVLEALQRCDELSLTAMQAFSGGRINRKVFFPPEEQWEHINRLSADKYLSVHAAYVINACTPDKEKSETAREHLLGSLEWAEALGFNSVLFHPGSALEGNPLQARHHLLENARLVLEAYQGPVKLLFENSAGDKRDRLVGRDLAELNQLAEEAGPPERIGLCVDTVHAWAGGYSLAQMAEELPELSRLEMLHFNVPLKGVSCGSRKDRHGTLASTDWSEKDVSDLALALKEYPLIMETRDITDAGQLQEILSQKT